jgi:hypothetical protein
MTYTGSNPYPDRIEVRDNGILTQFFKIQQNAGQITKVETFAAGDSSKAQQIMSLNYMNGKLKQVILDVYDAFSKSYFEFINADSIQTDGKHNPLAQSFATIYMNIDNPFAFSKENITAASLTVLTQPTTFDSEYTYNAKDYALTAVINIPNFVKDLKFTYSCFD